MGAHLLSASCHFRSVTPFWVSKKVPRKRVRAVVKPRIRKRNRVSFDLTPQEIEQIDGSRGTMARPQFLRERIFHSSGFASPVHGAVSRLLGHLTAHQPDAWEVIMAVTGLMQEMSDIRKAFPNDANTAEVKRMLDLAQKVQTDLSALSQLAHEQKEVLAEIRSGVSELVRVITPPEPTPGTQPGPQLHRPKR